jgi:hypothetical protein
MPNIALFGVAVVLELAKSSSGVAAAVIGGGSR